MGHSEVSFSYSKLEALWPGDGRTLAGSFAANQILKAGMVLGQFSGTATNERQTLAISGSPTGGTFRAGFAGNWTPDLVYNATSAAIEAAVTALPGIGVGNAHVTTASGGWQIEFVGILAAQPQALLSVSGSFTGGSSPSIVVTQAAAGVASGKWAPYRHSASDGTEIAKGVLSVDIATGPSGAVTFGSAPTGGEHGETFASAPIYFKGEFKTSSLIGLDSYAIGSFARLVSGSLTDGIVTLL